MRVDHLHIGVHELIPRLRLGGVGKDTHQTETGFCFGQGLRHAVHP